MNKENFGFAEVLLLVVVAVIAWMLGYVQASSSSTDYWCNGAIKAGVGEYVLIDAKTGKTEFKWKEIQKDLKN